MTSIVIYHESHYVGVLDMCGNNNNNNNYYSIDSLPFSTECMKLYEKKNLMSNDSRVE